MTEHKEGYYYDTLEKAKLKALYECNIEPTQENINHYEKCEYLTINTGRNGRDYAWYGDEHNSVAVDIETLDVLSSIEIEEQFL